MTPSGFAIASAAFAQDQLYTNGGLNYNLRGYGTVGSNQQNSGAAQTNGQSSNIKGDLFEYLIICLELTGLKITYSVLTTSCTNKLGF